MDSFDSYDSNVVPRGTYEFLEYYESYGFQWVPMDSKDSYDSHGLPGIPVDSYDSCDSNGFLWIHWFHKILMMWQDLFLCFVFLCFYG